VRYLTIVLAVLLISCSGDFALNTEYESLQGDKFRPVETFQENEINVLLFLSPECPLCQNYAPTIQEIQRSFSDRSVSFYGIVSGEFYSRKDILKYKLKYDLNFPILLDPEIKLAEELGASITPEAVVITANNKVIYTGAIDNWAISLGQKRIQASAHYLSDAIGNHLDGKKINPKKTEAVGCFIE